ncbi:hypothetical protein [Galenea microaerophila]
MQNKRADHLMIKNAWPPSIVRTFAVLFFLLGLFLILSFLGQKSVEQLTAHHEQAMPCCQQMAETDCHCCQHSSADQSCSITCSSSCAMGHAISPFMPLLLDFSDLYAPNLYLRLAALTFLFLPNPELDSLFRPPRHLS